MQELLRWVDVEAEQVRIDWRNGFDWRKFQEQIERKFASQRARSAESLAL